MTDKSIYENNPLHGIGLEQVLTELVDHYGFDLLNAYLSLNCFKTNASIKSSIKFLKKTDWAKDKVEGFYLYQYKNLPRADDDQFQLPPRDRIIPVHQKPAEPAELSFEDAENLRQKRAKKTRERSSTPDNPWGK
ncbi:MAG: VF530 family DNA-binding protein [Colwellia sp.]